MLKSKPLFKSSLWLCTLLFINTQLAAQDTTNVFYEADHPNILYNGRIDFTNPKKPVFSAPAVYITAKFVGVSVAVRFQDEYLWKQYVNSYNVIIDNDRVYKIMPDSVASIQSTQIVKGLPYGEHTVTFVKRNESGIGKCTFLGFEFGGTIAAAPIASGRKIQIFGNSISSGAGDENSFNCAGDWVKQIPNSNAYRSFGPVLARMFNADYHLTSASGIGLVRNCCDTMRSMEKIYDYLELNLYKNDRRKWDLTKFIPDVVLIELGTNDFGFSGTFPDRGVMDTVLFKKRYIRFIKTLKVSWPNAKYFCLGSPMLGDNWEPVAPSYMSRTNFDKVLSNIASHYKNIGDTNVVWVPISKVVGLGCDKSHPSVEEQQNIAREIAPYFVSELNWPLPEGVTGAHMLNDPIGAIDWNNVVTDVSDIRMAQFGNLVVVPNPKDSKATLSWEKPCNFTVRVYDIHGKEQMKFSGSGNSAVVDLSNLKKGIYNVHLEQKGGSTKITKLIVQ